MNKENNIVLGILFMTFAMLCLSVNDVLVKGLSKAFPIWEVIFFRALSGVIISVILIIFFGWRTLKTEKPLGHLTRAFASVACVVFYFFGLKHLMLSENVAIVHSAPILATLLAVPFLGEKLGFHRITAVVLGFVGVLVIVKPGSDLFRLETLFPLAAAFFMAIAYLATRFLMSTESSVSIIFNYSLALLITSLVFFPNNFVIPSLYNLIPLMALGVMGSLGHYFMSQAAKSAEVVVITPFEYTSFIFLGIMGYFFYNEVPDASVITGMLLIVLSGIYIVYREQQKKKNIVSKSILKNSR